MWVHWGRETTSASVFASHSASVILHRVVIKNEWWSTLKCKLLLVHDNKYRHACLFLLKLCKSIYLCCVMWCSETELWASFSLLFWSLWLSHLSSVSSCSCFQWLMSKPNAYYVLQTADGQIQWLDVELFLSQTRGEPVWWTRNQSNHSRMHLANVSFCKTTDLFKLYISSCCNFTFLHLASMRKRSWFGL